MQPRKPTFSYIMFYLLFSTATWQIIIGGIVTLLIAPYLVDQTMGLAGQVVLSLMLLTCAAWLAVYPARKITGALKKFFI